MARKNRITMDFNNFNEYMKKLDEVGGSPAMKKGVEAGLVASKEFVNTKLEKAIKKSNLPAKGKYSSGKTESSIIDNNDIDWSGLKASTKVGFEFQKSGLISIFLMYGTPRMSPVRGLKAAIYGGATKKKLKELQEEKVLSVIHEIMGD